MIDNHYRGFVLVAFFMAGMWLAWAGYALWYHLR